MSHKATISFHFVSLALFFAPSILIPRSGLLDDLAIALFNVKSNCIISSVASFVASVPAVCLQARYTYSSDGWPLE